MFIFVRFELCLVGAEVLQPRCVAAYHSRPWGDHRKVRPHCLGLSLIVCMCRLLPVVDPTVSGTCLSLSIVLCMDSHPFLYLFLVRLQSRQQKVPTTRRRPPLPRADRPRTRSLCCGAICSQRSTCCECCRNSQRGKRSASARWCSTKLPCVRLAAGSVLLAHAYCF